MFNISVVGDADLVLALEAMPGSVRKMLGNEVRELALNLREHVVHDKLAGQVLGKITGHLSQSIQTDAPQFDGDTVFGEVYSTGDVKYAVIHEYGLTVARVSKLGKHFDAHYPERSFLRSAMADRYDYISEHLIAAVGRGMRAPFGGAA